MWRGLGTHLISKDRHELKLAAMCEPTECLDWITISPVERDVEEALFSFVLISDSHLGLKERSMINNLWLSDKMPEIMDMVIKEINQLSPDFVIHLGDIADDGRNLDDLITVRKLLDKLKCRCHLVLGNHDTWGNSRINISKAFPFPESENKSYYSFEWGEFLFIILDSSYWLYEDNFVDDSYNRNHKCPMKDIVMPKEQLLWLENNLAGNRSRKVFLFLHALMMPADERPWDSKRRGPGEGHCFFNWREALGIIDKYDNTKAVFSGHSHINELSVGKGVHHYQVGSLVEYPFLYQEVVVFASHIEVRSYQISDRSYPLESYVEEKGNNWMGTNSDLYSEIKI